MIKYSKIIIAVFSIAVLVASCNKTKSTSKRLMKAGEWNVTELSVDGVNQEELPHWVIGDCDIYEESCIGSWQNDEGGATDFVWQVQTREAHSLFLGKVRMKDWSTRMKKWRRNVLNSAVLTK